VNFGQNKALETSNKRS